MGSDEYWTFPLMELTTDLLKALSEICKTSADLLSIASHAECSQDSNGMPRRYIVCVFCLFSYYNCMAMAGLGYPRGREEIVNRVNLSCSKTVDLTRVDFYSIFLCSVMNCSSVGHFWYLGPGWGQVLIPALHNCIDKQKITYWFLNTISWILVGS